MNTDEYRRIPTSTRVIPYERSEADVLYTVHQVAERLNMSVTWVRKTFGRRQGVLFLGAMKNMRIPASVLAQYMAESGYRGTDT